MSQPLTVQELAIVIAAKNQNPSILNPDFLKYSGIIPAGWEFATKPMFSNNFTRVSFKNGVSIVGEPNRVIFAESIPDKTAATISIANIAQKYAQALPNMDFQAVGVNPRGFVAFTEKDAARNFITENLLSAGTWKEEGEEPIQASLNLVYKLKNIPVALNITQAELRQKDKTIPIVIFSGNFSYQITSNDTEGKLSSIEQAIKNSFDDVTTFSDLINNKFLAGLDGNIALTKIVDNIPDANSESSNVFAVGAGA